MFDYMFRMYFFFVSLLLLLFLRSHNFSNESAESIACHSDEYPYPPHAYCILMFISTTFCVGYLFSRCCNFSIDCKMQKIKNRNRGKEKEMYVNYLFYRFA